MYLVTSDPRCRHAGCPRQRFMVPGVIGSRWCYRHMPVETRACLWAMVAP